jgi:hypothetical protein
MNDGKQFCLVGMAIPKQTVFTNLMCWSLSEAESSLASQDFSHAVGNMKFHHVHKSMPLDLILKPLKSVPCCFIYLSKIYINPIALFNVAFKFTNALFKLLV